MSSLVDVCSFWNMTCIFRSLSKYTRSTNSSLAPQVGCACACKIAQSLRAGNLLIAGTVAGIVSVLPEYVIGASLSEPHTSESNSAPVSIIIIIMVRTSTESKYKNSNFAYYALRMRSALHVRHYV